MGCWKTKCWCQRDSRNQVLVPKLSDSALDRIWGLNQRGTTIVCFPLPNITKLTKIKIGDNEEEEEEEVSTFLGFFMEFFVVFDKFCGVLDFFLKKDNDVDI